MARPKKTSTTLTALSSDEAVSFSETTQEMTMSQEEAVKKTAPKENLTMRTAFTQVFTERVDPVYLPDPIDYSGFVFKGKNLRKDKPNDEGIYECKFHFKNANLEGASFEGCDLSGLNFQGANLRGVNFKGANLEGTDFRWSDVTGAIYDENTNFTLANFVETDGGLKSMVNA